jgi:hypothetical protein
MVINTQKINKIIINCFGQIRVGVIHELPLLIATTDSSLTQNLPKIYQKKGGF